MSATTVDRPVTTDGSDEVVRLPRRTIDKLLVAIGLVAAIVFAAAGAMLMWGSNFAEDYVHDELASQNVVFSDADSLREEGRDDLVKYADEQVTTGAEAEAYASYIGGHLEGIADGKTYAEIDDRGAAQAVVDARESGASEAEIAELQATATELKDPAGLAVPGRDPARPAAVQLRLGHRRCHRRHRRLRRLRRRRSPAGPGHRRRDPPAPHDRLTPGCARFGETQPASDGTAGLPPPGGLARPAPASPAAGDDGVLRIVLTGGPGGGKTTAADLFRRELGERVVVVPESATILFGGGFPRAGDRPRSSRPSGPSTRCSATWRTCTPRCTPSGSSCAIAARSTAPPTGRPAATSSSPAWARRMPASSPATTP